MCYQQKISTQIARVPHTYVAENKEVPDSNIGVPPVRKYANYRTLPVDYTPCDLQPPMPDNLRVFMWMNLRSQELNLRSCNFCEALYH